MFYLVPRWGGLKGEQCGQRDNANGKTYGTQPHASEYTLIDRSVPLKTHTGQNKSL